MAYSSSSEAIFVRPHSLNAVISPRFSFDNGFALPIVNYLIINNKIDVKKVYKVKLYELVKVLHVKVLWWYNRRTRHETDCLCNYAETKSNQFIDKSLSVRLFCNRENNIESLLQPEIDHCAGYIKNHCTNNNLFRAVFVQFIFFFFSINASIFLSRTAYII